MKPWETLGTAAAPDGTVITLARRDTEYVLLANGQLLMTNRMHASERQLADVACDVIAGRPAPVVLVGGLGMGYTIRAALDRLPPEAAIVVAELVPSVVEWNEGVLGPLADHPLRDARVTVDPRDIADILRESRERFDAILLDVDNGADPFASTTNRRLYGPSGLSAMRAALRPDGVLTVWSAGPDKRFVRQLRTAGFQVETRHVRARPGGRGPRHVVFIARIR